MLYLEYDALRRLGIDNPQVYVSKRYCGTSKESNVIQLKSCAIGEIILKELEGAIDDIHTSKMGWIDVLVRRYTFCGKPNLVIVKFESSV